MGKLTDPGSDYAKAVRKLVRRIPRGRVMTYGLIAEIVGDQMGCGGPRVVGNILAASGGRDPSFAELRAHGKALVGPAQDNFDLPWWRVVNAQGDPPAHYRTLAMSAFEREQTPMKRSNDRIDLKMAIWYPEQDKTLEMLEKI